MAKYCKVNGRCCIYWKGTYVNTWKFCHYMYETGKRKEVVGDVCLSFTPEKRTRKQKKA